MTNGLAVLAHWSVRQNAKLKRFTSLRQTVYTRCRNKISETLEHLATTSASMHQVKIVKIVKIHCRQKLWKICAMEILCRFG